MTRLHIFKAGEHVAMDGGSYSFSESDLARTAAAYDPALHEAPIVIGHPKADAPAYGWVKGLHVEGGDLYADTVQVNSEFAEVVRSGQFKKISASFYTPGSRSNPKPGTNYLRHVGFLGAQPPAVKGLREASFSEEDDAVADFEEVSLNPREWALEQALNSSQSEARRRYVDDLVNAGRLLPYEREGAAAFIESLSDAETVSFSEGNAEVSRGQLTWFKRFIETRPPVVEFREMSAPGDELPPKGFAAPVGYTVDLEALEVHNRALAFQEAHGGISYRDAVLAVVRET